MTHDLTDRLEGVILSGLASKADELMTFLDPADLRPNWSRFLKRESIVTDTDDAECCDRQGSLGICSYRNCVPN
jgi:hypothetical protein